jgi:lysophospholipase L1-like esterase
MADKILHKRSSTAAAVPTAGSLELGELAVNTADGLLFFKKGSGDIVTLSEVDLSEAGVEIESYTAGLSSSTSVAGSSFQIAVGSSAPGASDGYALISQTLDTFEGQHVHLDILIPFIAISSAGNLVVTVWAGGVLVATLVDRLTSGATSGNGVSLKAGFVAGVGTTTAVVVRIGPASSSHTLTLYSRLASAAQPKMIVTKYGQLVATGVGGAPAPSVATGGRKTIAIAGDSVTGQNSGTTSRERLRDIGYMTWALALCEQRVYFDKGWNFGVGGDNSADLLARINDVLAAGTDYVLVSIGGNDVTQSITSDETCANLEAIWDACYAAGKFVLASMIYPRGPQTTYTAAHKTKCARINNYIQQAQYRRERFEVLNPIPIFTDYSDGDGLSLEYMTYDGIHPGTWGAWRLGRSIAEIINALEPPRDDMFFDPSNVWHATDNPYGNLLPNGMLLGTGGSVSGGTGDVAASSQVDAVGGLSVVASKVTSHRGVPAQRFVISGTAGVGVGQCALQQIAPDWPIGTDVEALCVVRVDASVNLAGLQFDIRIDRGAGGILYAMAGELTTMTDVQAMRLPDGSWVGVMRTPVITIPADAIDVRVRIGAGGYPGSTVSGAIEVSQIVLRPVMTT